MQRPLLTKNFKRSALAVAIGLASLGAIEHASAYTFIDTDTDKFSIGGRLAYDYQWHAGGGDKDKFLNAGSRVNVVYEHKFFNGWTGGARWEEGFDPLFTTHEGDDHFNRYRYIYASNDTYGTFSVGAQDSVMYDFVDVFTDQPWDFTDYSSQSWMQGYGDGTRLNGARPANTGKYEVTLGDWKLGAMYGTSYKQSSEGATGPNGSALDGNIKRKYLAQAGVNYMPGYDVTLGAAYSHAKLELPGYSSDDDVSTNNWEGAVNWTPGNWFLSAVAGQSRNLVDLSGDTYNNYDLYASYTWPKLIMGKADLQLEGEYSRYQNKSNHNQKLDRKILEAATIWLDGTLIVALDHMWMDDTGDSINGGKAGLYAHDTTALFVRYNY